MNDIEKAIDIYRDNIWHMELNPESYEDDLPRYKLVLKALLEMADKGCEYCTSKNNIPFAKLGTRNYRCNLFIKNNKLYMDLETNSKEILDNIEITNCPMCGRKLGK